MILFSIFLAFLSLDTYEELVLGYGFPTTSGAVTGLAVFTETDVIRLTGEGKPVILVLILLFSLLFFFLFVFGFLVFPRTRWGGSQNTK